MTGTGGRVPQGPPRREAPRILRKLRADRLGLMSEAVHEYGVTLKTWDELPQSHALIAAVAHREFKERSTGEYVAKLIASAPFIDVKSAFDADAIRAGGATVWRL